jgi:hypothetical protein
MAFRVSGKNSCFLIVDEFKSMNFLGIKQIVRYKAKMPCVDTFFRKICFGL